MFQLSLSTLLTSPTTPGAGLIPALSGDFAAALAGIAEASAQPVPAAAASATPRQVDAETGKSLPTATAAPTLDPALAWFGEGDVAVAAPIVSAASPATADGLDPAGLAHSPSPEPARRASAAAVVSTSNITAPPAPASVSTAEARFLTTPAARPQPAPAAAAAASALGTAEPLPPPPVGDPSAPDALAPAAPHPDRAGTTVGAQTVRSAPKATPPGQTPAAAPRVATADQAPAPVAMPTAGIDTPAAAPASCAELAAAQDEASHDIDLTAKIQVAAPHSVMPAPPKRQAAAASESVTPDRVATGISLPHDDVSTATVVDPEAAQASATPDDKKAAADPEKDRKAGHAAAPPQPFVPAAAAAMPPQPLADANPPHPVAITRIRDGRPVVADRIAAPVAPNTPRAADPAPSPAAIPEVAATARSLDPARPKAAPHPSAESVMQAFAPSRAIGSAPATSPSAALGRAPTHNPLLKDRAPVRPDPGLTHEARPAHAIVYPVARPASRQADAVRIVAVPAPVDPSTRPIAPARLVTPVSARPVIAPTPPAAVAPAVMARADHPAAAQHGNVTPAPAAALASRPIPVPPAPISSQPALPTPAAAPAAPIPTTDTTAMPASAPSQSAPAAPAHPIAAQPSMMRLAADSPPTVDTLAPAAQVPAVPIRPAPAAQPAQPAAIVLGVAFGGMLPPPRPLADAPPSPRDQALQALTALAGAGPAAPIAAASQTQHGALDMRRDDWPQAMIDRIEALRDAADATSTRITLAPDALGKVDLSIRHDGGTVHVHFAADAAQTRTLLADAQPKLAELAQQRGFRLGQATVDAGASGGGQRQQPHSPAPPPQRPASAFASTTADNAAADPPRLA